MKLKNFRMTKSGNYLNNYELTYINKAGNDKVYEMVSREKYKDVNDVGKKTAGVIIVAFTNDGEEEKILLVREFRMGVNEYVYAFPAGLSDADETVEQTATRELKEETGAKDFTLEPVCIYGVKEGDGDETYGMLCVADITSFEPFDSEIEKIVITDTLPDNWTYPTVQPYLLKELKRRNLI